MATIDVPFNPNLTPELVYEAINIGFGPSSQIKKPPRLPGAASVIVQRGNVQAAVKLHQHPDRTYLVVNSQPASIIQMMLLGFIFAYLFTASKRTTLENEVIDYLKRWLVPA